MKTINKKLAAGLLAVPLMTAAGAAYASADTVHTLHEEDVVLDCALSPEEEAYFAKVDQLVSDHDWDTLSLKQIDATLAAAGLDTIGDETDPLYAYSPADIEKMTDEDWDKIDAAYADLYGDDYEDELFSDEDWDKIDALFTDQEWETLSDEAFEQRIVDAGFGDYFELEVE